MTWGLYCRVTLVATILGRDPKDSADLGQGDDPLRPPLDSGLFRAGQARAAPGAAARLVPDHAIGPIGQLEGLSRLPLRPDRPAAGSSCAATWAPACPPVRGRRPRRVLRTGPQPRRQLGDLRLQYRDQRAQLRDLRVPFSQQLPQPAVGGTQRSRSPGACRKSPESAQGNQGDTPGRLKKSNKPRSKGQSRNLSSYNLPN